LGMELPASHTVLAGRTVFVSLLFGVGITTLAGLIPAVRATRVEPVAALREGAVPQARHSRVTPVLGAILTAVAVAAMVYGMFAGGVSVGGRLAAIGLGCLALFLGVAMLSSRLVGPLVSLLGRPGERIAGAAGQLARENAMRNPHRTAVTAAALMIGIALVTLAATFGQGVKSSWKESYAKQLQTDYVLTAGDGSVPVAGGAAKAVASTPGVGTVTAIREDQARVYDQVMPVDGVDPATIGRIYDYHWKRGSEGALDRLGPDGAIVIERFAKQHHLAVGDRVPITSADGTRRDLTVRGIDSRPKFNPLNLGSVSVSHELYARLFPQARDDQLVLFTVDHGAGAATRSQLDRALAPFPGTKLKTSSEYRKLGDTWINNMLGLLYGLLGLSVIVSLFGIVNTLALAVFERTREIGTLRAVGMTRRQVRRMMRHEGILVALIGAVLGMALGLLLGALVAKAMAGEGMTFAVPVGSLVAFLLVAVVAGTLAAILPARRASRLDVLNALQYE
ncbi:MAG: putative transport system permease protein, partial [Thermoleophilales bacterium]|nr:putative transport system permease protein [Thermoleophilales bacterium]